MSLVANLRLRAGRIASAAAVALLPLLCGGWITGPQSTFEPLGPVARAQQHTFYVTVWVSLVIFILVGGVLAYATIKFRARNQEDEHAEPPAQSHGNPLVELSLIGASVLALVIIAVPTLRVIWYSYDVPEMERENVYEVTATGYQWWFKFDYPAEQIDNQGHLITANELVIPAGRPIRIQLRTVDVIHSFWVPKLAGKVDMIPNRGNFLWLQADEPGYFWGQCAEYCGESHAVMRFRVIALGEEDFRVWVESKKQPARTVEATAAAGSAARAQFATYRPNQPGWSPEFDADPMGNWHQKQFPDADEDAALIARGRELFQTKTCVACHTVRGHEGGGIVGPDLTHVGSRTTIAGGLLENTLENMHRWLLEPNNVKPGNLMFYGRAMPGYMRRDEHGNWVKNFEVSSEESHALSAYLLSLK
jgi:cytochrome c oxidase subunit II